MEGNSTEVDEETNDWLFLHNPWAMALFVLGHCCTFASIAMFAKMMHDRAEMSHPVFAVIFQELVVMMMCEMSALVLLGALVSNPDNTVLLVIYSTPALIAMQFHQVTWLMVTCLRYYLLVKTKPSDFIDVQAMTKKSCILVWIVAVPLLLSTRMVEYATITGKCWPNVPNINDIKHSVLVSAMMISNFFNNIPDFFSIFIYLKMSKHFSKKSVHVHPNASDQEGIWMGDVEVAEPPEIHENESQQIHTSESKAILAKLRLHVSVSLLDMAYHIINAILVRTVTGSIIIKIYFVVICYWLPLFVVKHNVKQLNGMLIYIIKCLTCKTASYHN